MGCDTHSGERPALTGEAQAALPGAGTTTSESVDPFAPTRQLVTDARRDVREVLLEARAELVALSGEATELRARLARQQPGMRMARAIEFPREAPLPPSSTSPVLVEAAVMVAPPVVVESPVVIESPRVRVQPLRPAIASVRPRIQSSPIHHTAVPSSRRLWIAAVAAALFASTGLVVFLSSSRRSDAVDGRKVSAAPSSRPADKPGAKPAANAGLPASDRSSTSASTSPVGPRPTLDRSVVSVAITVRRPVWMRTTLNGAADAGRVYAAGESKKVMARQDVVLRAGDAGAVLVSVDGEAPRPLGPDGVVMSRRFAPRQPGPTPAAAAVRETPAQRSPVSAAPDSMTPAARPADSRNAQLRAPEPNAAAPRPPESRAAEPRAVEPRAAKPTTPVAVPAGARADVGTAGTTELQPPPAPARTRPLQEGPPPSTPAEREIVAANQRWFEAYYSEDQAGMSSVSTSDFSLADQRTARPRFPFGNVGVQRSMDQVRIDVAGESAVLSARLIERASVEGQAVQSISMVSEVWIRRDGRWRLMGVRLVDAANLGRVPQ